MVVVDFGLVQSPCEDIYRREKVGSFGRINLRQAQLIDGLIGREKKNPYKFVSFLPTSFLLLSLLKQNVQSMHLCMNVWIDGG